MTDFPRAAEIATIIAEETEAERERRQKKPLAKSGRGKNTTNVLSALLGPPGYQFDYVDTLIWEMLLSHGDCVIDCAERAGLSVPDLLDPTPTR